MRNLRTETTSPPAMVTFKHRTSLSWRSRKPGKTLNWLTPKSKNRMKISTPCKKRNRLTIHRPGWRQIRIPLTSPKIPRISQKKTNPLNVLRKTCRMRGRRCWMPKTRFPARHRTRHPTAVIKKPNALKHALRISSKIVNSSWPCPYFETPEIFISSPNPASQPPCETAPKLPNRKCRPPKIRSPKTASRRKNINRAFNAKGSPTEPTTAKIM